MQPKELRIAIGAAVGGALLTVGGQVAVEAFKSSQLTRHEGVTTAEQSERQKQDLLDQLNREFGQLGDIPRRAAEYVETGKVGSPAEVRAVSRHLGRLIRLMSAGRISVEEAVAYQGGALGAWGSRFDELSSRRSPTARQFTDMELFNFGLLGSALTYAASKDDMKIVDDPMAAYTAMSNDAMMSNDSVIATNAM